MVLAFGDLRLDIERRELRRGGEPVDLAPKALDLLAYPCAAPRPSGQQG